MQLPIITSHRPTIGHRALGAALATVTLAIAGTAVWALASSVGGTTSEPTARTGVSSLAPFEARVSVVEVALPGELTVFVVSDYEQSLAVSSWLDAAITDPGAREAIAVHVANADSQASTLASFLQLIGASSVVDLRPS